MDRLFSLILSLFSAITLPLAPHPIPVVLPRVSDELIARLDHSWTATLSAEQTFTLVATGDVLTARTINKRSVELNDYLWPWRKTQDLLINADITLINLETPLIATCPLSVTGTVFCGQPESTSGLLFAGVDIANLANNHIGNYGAEGIIETTERLKASGIKYTGIDTPAEVDIKGLRVSFLGFNDIYPETPGGYWAYPDSIRKQVAAASESSDLVIVQFHWGNEYTRIVSPRQIELAHIAVDAGADLIIGNHPHWVQPFELYKDTFIMYSHGNFIFDQFWSTETRQGVVGKYTFYGTNLVDVEFVPVFIDQFGAPEISAYTANFPRVSPRTK